MALLPNSSNLRDKNRKIQLNRDQFNMEKEKNIVHNFGTGYSPMMGSSSFR